MAATGNCHYLRKEDEICRRVIRVVDGHEHDNKQYFYHTTDEMLTEFSYLGEDSAYETVVTNPNRIADLITQVTPLKEGVYPPVIPNANEQVQKMAYAKAKEMYGESLPLPVAERLETELKYIQKYEYSVYYWLAYRMVKYMNDSGYYVGNRGSVGSVLVAFLLGISDTNPLPAHYYCPQCHHTDFDVPAWDGFDLPDQICPVCGCVLQLDGHNIPYEIFMGYDGSKMPDIDLNFPATKQYSEFAFIQELFGADKVAHAGTISTLWERSAEGYISVYGAKTDDYFTEEQRSYICEKLCGIKRKDNFHPGGIFAVPQGMEFEDFTPLRETKSPSPIPKATHFDFHSLHDTVIKIDVLGHNTPDILKLLEEFTGRSIRDVAWNDPNVYALFAHADTLGIPEFDTDFMKDMLLKLKPSSFDDLVQISGLSHGTGTWIDNGENLLNDGHTLSEIPALRDKVFLQLMRYGLERDSAYQIAECVRTGRLACNSNLTFELVKHMRGNNVPEWYIQSLRKIWYLFPKAHAVTYVMNAVRMAWYKTYYPVEFYAAVLTCDRDNSSYCSILAKGKTEVEIQLNQPDESFNEGSEFPQQDDEKYVLKLALECFARGITFLPANDNTSDSRKFLPENGNLRIPLLDREGEDRNRISGEAVK